MKKAMVLFTMTSACALRKVGPGSWWIPFALSKEVPRAATTPRM